MKYPIIIDIPLCSLPESEILRLHHMTIVLAERNVTINGKYKALEYIL